MLDFIDIPLYDDDLIKLAFRFAHNTFFLALIVRFAMTARGRDREFVFTAVLLNITVFFICFAMKKLELSLGMALGLFAIFGVLRYRTDTIRTKDMTYLFVVIGIAVVNALSNRKTSYAELIAVNTVIVAATLIFERYLARAAATPTKPRKQTVAYDRLELLADDRHDELLADLRQRTHLPVDDVRIETIDLANASATLTVRCRHAASLNG